MSYDAKFTVKGLVFVAWKVSGGWKARLETGSFVYGTYRLLKDAKADMSRYV